MRAFLARHRRWVATGLALGIGCSAGVAWAAFSSQASNLSEFSAAPDQRAPEVVRSVVGKAEGGEVGFIRPSGEYYIYAQVDDVGSPPSGTESVNGTVFGAPLASGSYTAGGQSYNWRTAQRPPTGASPDTYEYGFEVADNAGNSATRTGYTVVVDGTAPTASDVQTANGIGGISGRPELGDSITFTTSEPIDPQSVDDPWDGTATEVTVRVNNSGNNDQLLVYNRANSTQLPLGSVALRGNYVGANRTFGASGTRSSMTRSGNAITVTLGTQSGAGTTVTSNTAMSWTPAGGAYDRAGNTMTTTARNESGANDRDF